MVEHTWTATNNKLKQKIKWNNINNWLKATHSDSESNEKRRSRKPATEPKTQTDDVVNAVAGVYYSLLPTTSSQTTKYQRSYYYCNVLIPRNSQPSLFFFYLFIFFLAFLCVQLLRLSFVERLIHANNVCSHRHTQTHMHTARPDEWRQWRASTIQTTTKCIYTMYTACSVATAAAAVAVAAMATDRRQWHSHKKRTDTLSTPAHQHYFILLLLYFIRRIQWKESEWKGDGALQVLLFLSFWSYTHHCRQAAAVSHTYASHTNFKCFALCSSLTGSVNVCFGMLYTRTCTHLKGLLLTLLHADTNTVAHSHGCLSSIQCMYS